MEIDKIIKELFFAGLGLYFLSMFISIFDYKIGELLKKIAYLNIFSFLFLVAIQIWILFIRFTDTLERISNWRIF